MGGPAIELAKSEGPATKSFSFFAEHRAFVPFDEAVASGAVLVIVSASDGRADGNAFGASKITQKR